jgi:hypothetical protein
VKGDEQTNIVEEISPFIDDDTAIVCYVDLTAIQNVQRLIEIPDRLIEIDELPPFCRQYLSSVKNVMLAPKAVTGSLELLTPLLENKVTHLYIILNMKDMKFGPYFVIPGVNEYTTRARDIERFFGVLSQSAYENSSKKSDNVWAVYCKNCMIVGGSNFILSSINLIYNRPFEEYTTMMLFPQLESSFCGFYNLSFEDRKRNIKARFDNFNANKSVNFIRGLNELRDCNLIKSVFLFPDAIASWELVRLKKMESPFNETNFNFLQTSREFVAVGISTIQPKIKLVAQCPSKETAFELKQLIDGVWWNIFNNYCTYFEKKVPHYNNEKSATASEWADLLIDFLPRQINDRLVLEIDKNFNFEKTVPKSDNSQLNTKQKSDHN